MQTRPTAITVISILIWIFSGMGLVTSPWALLSVAAPEMLLGSEANPMIPVFAQYPAYQAFLVVMTLLGLGVAAGLMVGAFGLWKGKRWAWPVCTAAAVYMILAGLVGMVVNVAFVMPALMEAAGSDPAMTTGVAGAIGGSCGGVVGLVYPIGILITIHLSSAKQWRGQAG